jgi:hypothetical protein
MICQNCRYAGTQLQHMAENPALAELVQVSHEQCRGGTWCDCQHLLSGVNWEAINREASNADS